MEAVSLMLILSDKGNFGLFLSSGAVIDQLTGESSAFVGPIPFMRGKVRGMRALALCFGGSPGYFPPGGVNFPSLR